MRRHPISVLARRRFLATTSLLAGRPSLAGVTVALVLGIAAIPPPSGLGLSAPAAWAAEPPKAPKPPAGEDPEPGEPAPPPQTPEEIEREARAGFALLAESRSLCWDWMAIEDFAGTPGVEVIPAMLEELRMVPPKGLEKRAHLLASAIAYRARGQRTGCRLLDSEAAALLEFARKELRGPADVWTAYNIALGLAVAKRPAERAGIEDLLLDA